MDNPKYPNIYGILTPLTKFRYLLTEKQAGYDANGIGYQSLITEAAKLRASASLSKYCSSVGFSIQGR